MQKLLNEGVIREEVKPATLDALVESGVISPLLTAQDFTFLQKIGVLAPDLRYQAGTITLEDDSVIPANLNDKAARAAIVRQCLGQRLKGGHFAHACFFLGPQKFYDNLRKMNRSEREQICMTGISYVNELFGEEELKRLQRKAARFVNTGLIATLNGAVASDGLEDGRVLSGVGGQYNFVAMAHELEDGRSILMIRSTKEENGKAQSNIRWHYGHTTIPRHLKDIVVSEYGIADLRGRTDEEVITALIEIADSGFQDELVKEAIRAGKISRKYRLPDRARNNRREHLQDLLAPYREQGLFQSFPFGTDLTKEELNLRKALLAFKNQRKNFHLPRLTVLRKTASIPKAAFPYLERMELDRPKSMKEKLMQRTVVYALASVNAI